MPGDGGTQELTHTERRRGTEMFMCICTRTVYMYIVTWSLVKVWTFLLCISERFHCIYTCTCKQIKAR